MENENILLQIFENKLNQSKAKSINLTKQIEDKLNGYENLMNQISMINEMDTCLVQENDDLDGQLISANCSSMAELDNETKQLKLLNIRHSNEIERISSMIASVKSLVRSLRSNQLNVRSVSDCDQIELENSSASQMTSLSQRIHSIAERIDANQRANSHTRISVKTVFNSDVNCADDHFQRLFNDITEQNVCLNKQLIELNNNCVTVIKSNNILVELKIQREEQNKQINEMKKSLLELREQNNWLCDVLTEANFIDSGDEQPNHNESTDTNE